MEYRKAGGAAEDEDESRRMVAFELEAAEALAGMARGGASCFVGLRSQHAVDSVVTSQVPNYPNQIRINNRNS